MFFVWFNSYWINSTITNFFSKSISIYMCFLSSKSTLFLPIFFWFNNIDFILNFQYKIFFFNKALLNILALYHPGLLLLFFLCFFNFYKLKYYFIISKIIKNQRKYNTGIVSVTFFLGSYWSSNELLWNGFWNWDFVELTLLLLVLICIMFSHAFSINKNLIFFFFLKYMFYVLFLYFLINRTNLIQSQHSFSASFVYNINTFYIKSIFICVYTLFIIFFIKQNTINRYSFFLPLPVIIFFTIFFFLIFVSTLTLSIVLNKISFFWICLYVYTYISLVYSNLLCFLNYNVSHIILFFCFIKQQLRFNKFFLKYLHNYLSTIFFFFFIFFLSINFNQSTHYNFKQNDFVFYLNFFINILVLFNNSTTLVLGDVYSSIIFFKLLIFSDFIIFSNQLVNYQLTGYSLSFGFIYFIFLIFLSKLVLFLKTKL